MLVIEAASWAQVAEDYGKAATERLSPVKDGLVVKAKVRLAMPTARTYVLVNFHDTAYETMNTSSL